MNPIGSFLQGGVASTVPGVAMRKPHPRQYLETQVRTASPEELLILLFDGAVRFCEQAKVRIDEKDIEGSHNLLIRAQQIVLEVMTALDRDIGDEIYANLIGLYRFVYMRLVRANVTREKPLIDEAVEVLAHLRDTWRQAVDQARKSGALAGRVPPSHTNGTTGGSLSIQG